MLGDAPLGNARAKARLVQRNVILSMLFAQVATAWAVLVWESANASMNTTMGSSSMGVSALVCLVVMMVAMMFPSATPVILTYYDEQEKRHGNAFVLTWVFAAAYILAWTLAGAVAYGGVHAIEAIAAQADLSSATTARAGGAILVVAGIYQFTPLKELFLAKCRAPISFIASSWRDGVAGALRMGLLHGEYCLGCCWLLFVILFPLGIMNLWAMAAVTLIILAEKTLPWPRLASYAIGIALLFYGAFIIALPQYLPRSHVMARQCPPTDA
jgi:predicted metal-binding membrane protein